MSDVPTLAEQAEAMAALASLAKAHPALPGAHLTFVTAYTYGPRVLVQLQSLDALEAWREVLGVHGQDVVLDPLGDDQMTLEFDTAFEQVLLHVYVAFPKIQASEAAA